MSLPQNPSKSFVRLNPHLYGKAPCLIGDSPPGSETRPTAKRRLRQSSKPLMNILEGKLFDYMKKSLPVGTVIYPQAVTFRLANGVRLTPDFFCFDYPWVGESAMPTAIECKGKHAWEDSMIKLKFAATQFKEIRWLLAWKGLSGWCFQRILPLGCIHGKQLYGNCPQCAEYVERVINGTK